MSGYAVTLTTPSLYSPTTQTGESVQSLHTHNIGTDQGVQFIIALPKQVNAYSRTARTDESCSAFKLLREKRAYNLCTVL